MYLLEQLHNQYTILQVNQKGTRLIGLDCKNTYHLHQYKPTKRFQKNPMEFLASLRFDYVS